MEFYTLRRNANLSIEKAAEIFGRTPQTIRQWDHGQTPQYALTFTRYLSQDLSFHNPKWAGFYFDGDVLITPCRKVISPGDILSIPYLVQSCQLSRCLATLD
jgi:hypothetical protein